MTYQHIHVEGLAELEEGLKRLPDKIAKREGFRAVAKGAALIRNEARRQAIFFRGYSEGLIKKNIIQFKPRKGRDRNIEAQIDVGVRLRGSKKKRRALNSANRRSGGAGVRTRTAFGAYYWFFVEFGTRNMMAQPFLRPAFEAKKHAAYQKIIEEVKGSLYGAYKR